MHANDHKIQDMGVRKFIFISFYVVNQYHMKCAISVSPPKISMSKMWY